MSNHREFDIIVVGATGFTGKLVTAALAGHDVEFLSLSLPNAGVSLPVKYALMGRSKTSLQQLAKECNCAESVGLLPVADPAKDIAAVNAAVSQGTVVLNCLADDAADARTMVAKECAKTGTHLLDLFGTWDAQSGVQTPLTKEGDVELTKELDTHARTTKAVLCGWCGINAIPPELCILAGYNALKSPLKSATVYSAFYDGTPVEVVTKPKHMADNIPCGRAWAATINESSVVSSAKLLGWGTNFSYKEWSPTPVCLKKIAEKVRADKQVRAASKWDTFVVCEAEDSRTVTVSMKGGAEGMWEETARFLVETARLLIEKPGECPGIRTGGVLTPAAAIGVGLIDRYAQVGLPLVTIESQDVAVLLRSKLDQYNTYHAPAKL